MITFNLVLKMNNMLELEGFESVETFNPNWKEDTLKIKEKLYSYFGQSPFNDSNLNESINFCNNFIIKMVETENGQRN